MVGLSFFDRVLSATPCRGTPSCSSKGLLANGQLLLVNAAEGFTHSMQVVELNVSGSLQRLVRLHSPPSLQYNAMVLPFNGSTVTLPRVAGTCHAALRSSLQDHLWCKKHLCFFHNNCYTYHAGWKETLLALSTCHARLMSYIGFYSMPSC